MNMTRWILLLALVPGVANAQTAKPSAAAPKPQETASADVVSADPQSTSAAYGDWVHVCQRAGEPPQKICEVSQSVQLQGQSGPIAQLALGKTPGSTALHLTILLPPSVTLTTAPRVAADDKNTDAVDVPWARCLPGGCFADVAVKDDIIKRWRAQPSRGQIAFKDALGRNVLLPISFKGLTQALDALAKE